MTLPVELVTLQIFDSVTQSYSDYTDGFISASIERGQQEYSGPFTFPDTGILTLITRNRELDPYKNPLVRYNTKIALRSGTTRIFTGYIEGINVDYQTHGKPPIITIKAIDIIGLLAKHVLTEDFINLYPSWTTELLLNNLYLENSQFLTSAILTDGVTYADAPIEPGTTALEALQSRVKTDLGMLVPDRNGGMTYYRYDKNHPDHPYNALSSIIEFKDDGTGTSYQNITLSDGFTRVVNEIELNGINNAQVVLNNQDSINTWGKSSATIDVATDDTFVIQELGNLALDELAQPQRELTQITFDGLKTILPAGVSTAYPENITRFLSPYRTNVAVKHTVDDGYIIDRKYQVVGIKNEITYNDWITTIILRNVAYQTTGTTNPIIVRTPETGTQLTEFTYSFIYPDMNEITSVEWDVDDGFTATGNTITVTYPTGGTKTITLTLNTIYGYAKTVTVLYYVGDQAPTSSFTYTTDANNNYQFTFTGTGATSVLWQFGDGSQSTEFNPTKFYLNSGSITVSCVATNYVSTVTSTQTFSALKVAVIPVKFVKMTFYANTGWADDTTFGYSVLNPLWQMPNISTLAIRDTAYMSGNLVTSSWTLKDYQEYGGCMTRGPFSDDYRRLARMRKTDIADALKPNNTSSIFPYSTIKNNTTKVLRMTIELDNYYQNIASFYFSGTASKQMGSCDIDVSYDGSTWYKFGKADNSFNSLGNGSWAYDNPAYTHPNWNNTIVTYPTESQIRYIKVIPKVLSPISASYYKVNEMFPVGPDCKVNNGTYTYNSTTYENTITGCASLGGIDLDRNSGMSATIYFSQGYPSLQYLTSTGGVGSFGTSPAPESFINYKNLKDWTVWYRANTVEFILDLGTIRNDVSGFYFDWRTNTNSGVTTMTSDYKVSIYWSADGINWTPMQEDIQIVPTTGATGAFMIKTTPTTVNSYTFSPPITASSTFVVDYMTSNTIMRWYA